ncbi:MAG: hypothetical protein E6J83_17895, partial [Deltaproteobacteria bacterium]
MGEATRPFASPGDEVAVVRPDAAVFAKDPDGNTVTLTFADGTATAVRALAPLGLVEQRSSRCIESACVGDLCRCVRFTFPDTASLVGRHLAGPTVIEVRNATGELTARIDQLAAGSRIREPMTRAAPPVNAGAPRAVPRSSNPVPSTLRAGDDCMPDRIVEEELAVLRVELPREAAAAARLALPAPGTPLGLPQVQGNSDRTRWANPFSLVRGNRFAVYENRESGPGVPPGNEIDGLENERDLNGNTTKTDYILYALDLEG